MKALFKGLICLVNTLRPRQNGRYFVDDTFKRICFNENVRISINISLKFVPKVPINNIPALVQIMTGRRPGDPDDNDMMMMKVMIDINDSKHICAHDKIVTIWLKFT